MVGRLSIRSKAFSRFVNGSERVLVERGIPDHAEMRKALISRLDLEEAIHKHYGAEATTAVDRAVLERDGTVTLAEARDRSIRDA